MASLVLSVVGIAASAESEISSNPFPQKPRPIAALTGIRFFAAIMVVLFHCNLTQPMPWISRPISRGLVGVSLFYILSGFVLTYNFGSWFAAGLSGSRRFYIARIARVYPMYLVALCISVIFKIGPFLWNPALLTWMTGRTATIPDAALAWLANATCLQVYFPDRVFDALWLGPGWSIACEFFFYLTFPVLTRAAIMRIPRRRLMIAAAGTWTLQLVILIAARHVITVMHANGFTFFQHQIGSNGFEEDTHFLLYTNPLMRIPEFILGCILARLTVEFRPRVFNHAVGKSIILSISLIAVACLSVIPLHWIGLEEITCYIAFVPFLAALVCVLAAEGTAVTRFLSRPKVVLLGEASFSLYLIHVLPLESISFARRCGVSIGPYWILLLIPLLVAASIFFLKTVERPAQKRILALW